MERYAPLTTVLLVVILLLITTAQPVSAEEENTAVGVVAGRSLMPIVPTVNHTRALGFKMKQVEFSRTPLPQCVHYMLERVVSPQEQSDSSSMTGAKLKLINIRAVMGDVCVFDRYEVLETVDGKTPGKEVKVEEVSESNSQQDNSIPLSSRQHVFEPNSSKASEIEGGKLIGTLQANINLHNRPYANNQAAYFVEFALTDVVAPDTSILGCKMFLPDQPQLSLNQAQIHVDSLKIQAKKAPRFMLNNVRQENQADVCLYSNYTSLVKLDYMANVSQADVSRVTPAQIQEQESVYEKCSQTQRLNRHYRCDCFAERFLENRLLNPDAGEDVVISSMGNNCVHVAAITEYQHGQCMTREGDLETCDCRAKEIETVLIKQGNANLNAMSTMVVNATMTCR